MLRHLAGMGATVALLSGCTVPVVGMAGVGLDANGEVVGYLSVCEDHIDGATLYLDFSDPERSVDAGTWEAPAPVTRSARWSIDRGLQPGREYTLYGWTNDNSAATTSVTFTLEELQDLEPGRVLYYSGHSDGRTGRGDNASATESDFVDVACGP